VALSAEPDKLDPTLARTLVGRSVFNAICEKLYDVDAKLTIVPQLAAALPEFSADGLTVTIKIRNGVKFADGTALDAAAVKTSLDRHRTLAGSARASELSSVADVQVVDPATIAIKLKVPFTPLTAVLADRFRGKYSPACGPISPASPFSSDAAQACPKHDPAAAKALLTAAGVTMPVKTSMVIGNTADARRLGETIQAQVKEAASTWSCNPSSSRRR